MDTQNQEASGAATAPISTEGGIKLANGYTKLPNGVVLDQEGKPCRSCTSKSAFSAFAAQATKGTTVNKTTSTANLFDMNNLTPRKPPAECPPDVEALGRSTWTLLHSIAATYPETPSRGQQSDLVSFVGLFSKLYPCWVCAEDFQGYIKKEVPKVGSRNEFGKWLCGAHNEVNIKLGKPIFDCLKWEERWRTGPKDGSCD